jgi:hypothetical protein
MDVALEIALDYLDRTDQTVTFKEVKSTAATAIVGPGWFAASRRQSSPPRCGSPHRIWLPASNAEPAGHPLPRKGAQLRRLEVPAQWYWNSHDEPPSFATNESEQNWFGNLQRVTIDEIWYKAKDKQTDRERLEALTTACAEDAWSEHMLGHKLGYHLEVDIRNATLPIEQYREGKLTQSGTLSFAQPVRSRSESAPFAKHESSPRKSARTKS